MLVWNKCRNQKGFGRVSGCREQSQAGGVCSSAVVECGSLSCCFAAQKHPSGNKDTSTISFYRKGNECGQSCQCQLSRQVALSSKHRRALDNKHQFPNVWQLFLSFHICPYHAISKTHTMHFYFSKTSAWKYGVQVSADLYVVPHILPASSLTGMDKSQHSTPAPGLFRGCVFLLVNNSFLCG